MNDPFAMIPASSSVDGSQWHALTFLGKTWAQRDTRFPAERCAEWARTVTENGGAITFDMGPNWDAKAGPIGAISDAQMSQMAAVKQAVRGH